MTPNAVIEDAYPLTPMQEGMLFHALAAGGFETYIVQIGCRIAGLDPARWQDAWTAAIRRHAALRTAFAWKSQRNPLQLVGAHVDMPIREHDWRGVTDDEIARRLEAWRLADRRTGYDLAQAPLMRAALYRTGDDDHWFTWSFHHILLDAWSASMVLGEVLEAYDALVEGRRPRVEAAPPFRAYVDHLRRMPKPAAERFWRRALAGFTGPVPIPFAPPLAEAVASGGAEDPYGEEGARLSAGDTQAIQAFGREHKLTLSTLLRAAWGLVLCRFAQTRDVLFGAVVSGRPPDLRGVEAMVGLFVNTVPVRVRVPDDTSVREWLRRLHDDAIEATAYQYGSLAEILGYLDNRGQDPIDSILVVENLPAALRPTTKETRLRIDRPRTYWKTSYPLTVMAVPGPELVLQLAYDRRRYEAAQARQLLRAMITLLRGFVDRPDAHPWKVPIVAAEEVACARLSGPARPDFASTPAHELFEAVARRAGDRVALICGERTLSYRDLEARSRVVASALHEAGIGARARVALCLERSEAMVVALLGVMRAGACYVPLDPAFPPARLDYMVDDAACVAIITGTGQPTIGRAAVRAPMMLSIDELLTDSAGRADTWQPVAVAPRDLAYVIYTSGSSGRPKGVAVPHRALANLLRSMAEEPGITADDRLLAVTTISFDIAALELLLPLTTGATLMLATREETRDGETLARRIAASAPTIVQATPTLWRLLIDSGWPGGAGLAAFCGGEPLAPDLAAALSDRCGSVWNLYGPTETTIWSMVERIRPGQSRIALGKPIANTDILLLDADGQPAPPSLPGEIFIGGLGVADGYVGAPELTAEKFVPHPGADDGRLFRTGDLAWSHPDAGLCFIGRRDDQLKVRGFRVTAGEVEARLNLHPDVRASAVAVRVLHGTPTLIAYVVSRAPATVDAPALRAFLSRDLPDYMIPGVFVSIDELTRTANGKLDRQALPTPDSSRLVASCNSWRGSPIEEILGNFWRELLGTPQVEPHDNFFALGGHSLLAMRLVNRLNRAFGLQMPVRSLFDRPTIASLRDAIEADLRRDVARGDAPARGDPAEPAPLSFQQRRVWFIEHLSSDAAPYNLHAAVRMDGDLDHARLASALSAIVARHAVLRSRFVASPDGPVQIAHQEEPVLVVLDLRARPPESREAEIARHARATIAKRFDLGRGDALRVSLLQVEDQVHILLVVLHHIVADEWSMAILLDEMGTMYGALGGDQPSPRPLPPPLPLQYADFARWQQRRSTQPALLSHVEYWRQKLAGVRPLHLPCARPRGARQTFSGATLFFHVETPLLARLKHLSLRENSTLFATLLAAFRCLLHRETGDGDTAIGTLVAGRDREEFEALIGFFSNTVALRVTVTDDCTFRDVLRREMDGILSAWPHVQVPFEQVVDALALPRDPSRNPAFQVMFVLQNTPASAWPLDHPRLSPMLIDGGRVEFDLVLELFEADQALTLRLSFNAALFDRTPMLRLGERYLQMLEAIARDVDTRIATVPLVGADDDRAIRDFTDRLDSEQTTP